MLEVLDTPRAPASFSFQSHLYRLDLAQQYSLLVLKNVLYLYSSLLVTPFYCFQVEAFQLVNGHVKVMFILATKPHGKVTSANAESCFGDDFPVEYFG